MLTAALLRSDGVEPAELWSLLLQVKRILYEDEEGSSDSSQPGSASSEDEDIFEETAQVMHTHTHTVSIDPVATLSVS